MGFYRPNKPLIESWESIKNLFIAGTSGAGKTVLVRSLLLQNALEGAKYILLDVHGKAGVQSLVGSLEPLKHRYMIEPATNYDACIASLEYVEALCERRLQGESVTNRVVVVVDEALALWQNETVKPVITRVARLLASGGRKAEIHLVLLSQSLKSTVIDSASRDLFNTLILMANRKTSAGRAISNELANVLPHLKTGQAILDKLGQEPVFFNVPLTTADDVIRIAEEIKESQESQESVEPQLNPEELNLATWVQEGLSDGVIWRQMLKRKMGGAYAKWREDVVTPLRERLGVPNPGVIS